MFGKTAVALVGGACVWLCGFNAANGFDRVVPAYGVVVERSAPQQQPLHVAPGEHSSLGGGLIEFLFGGGADQSYRHAAPFEPQPADPADYADPAMAPGRMQNEADGGMNSPPGAFDPRFEKQLVAYDGREAPGTIVIDTPNKYLYLVQRGGMALRYGIGVGRPGFTWSGVKRVSAKREWPDWTPPAQMLERRPDLPRHMEGGVDNPLGARAIYLGSSLYRIHGSNEPWTIGTNVSSGCIRMRNQDVIDLYGRVTVGTRVIVI